MAQAADITLYSDGATALEPHVFNPQSVSPQSATFIDRSGQSSAGNPTFVLALQGSKPSRKTDHANFRLNFPIERQVGDPAYGQYEVAGVARAKIELIEPDIMTAAEKEDFYNLVDQLMGHAVTKKYVTDQEPVW